MSHAYYYMLSNTVFVPNFCICVHGYFMGLNLF